jgi:hypothetical protein
MKEAWGEVKISYTPEEVTKIENKAYEAGLAVGRYSEQKKLIDLIESMNTYPATSSLGSLVWTKHLINNINKNI